MTGSATDPRPADNELLDAVMAVASHLDLGEVLDRIVDRACGLTGAAYGALGVLSTPDAPTPVTLEQFHHLGFPPELTRHLGTLPRGHGVLGVLIDDPRPLRLSELSEHPRAVGLPSTHPPMHTFLGVPIRVRGTIFGNLYLCEKAGGEQFTADDERLIVGLAAAAGVAIDNARLFADAHVRQSWMAAAAEVSAGLSRNPAVFPALVARLACEAGGCTSVAVALLPAPHDLEQSTDARGRVVINGAAGRDADQLLQWSVSPGADGISPAAQLFDGPPEDCATLELDAGDGSLGLLVLRRAGQRWTTTELESATTFATQVALALDHALNERSRHRLAVLQDRDRIARDLHDRVIQRLFAVGLGIHSLLRKTSDEESRVRLRTYIEDLNDTITELRTSIFFLHHDPSTGPRSLRNDVLTVMGESSRILGFTPHVTFVGPVDQHLPTHLRTDLLATLRESLSNVIRHARAGAVDVLVRWEVDDRRLTLEVDDDGVGYDPTAAGGLGLRNTAARAMAAGGSAEVSARAGGGTSFRWSITVPPMAKADSA